MRPCKTVGKKKIKRNYFNSSCSVAGGDFCCAAGALLFCD